MDKATYSIQQLKEMYNKLQNLNTDVSNAIGSSREFQSKLEGNVQESLCKLHQNLDQSINTERVQQNGNILYDVQAQYEQNCSYIQDQNYNLAMRLHLMEKQEDDYKNQIDNLNNQLKEKGLIWNYESHKHNSQPTDFSFVCNNDYQQEHNEEKNQLQEFKNEPLNESLFLRNEIQKMKQEIDFLLQEKKNIIEQQEKILHENNLQDNHTLYFEEYQNPYFGLHQQDGNLANSQNSQKSSNLEFANFELNDIQNFQRVGNKEIIQEYQNTIDNSQEIQINQNDNDDYLKKACKSQSSRCKDQTDISLEQISFQIGIDNIQFNELQNIVNEQNSNNSSPKYVELIESMSVKGFKQNKQDIIIEQENMQLIKKEIEKRLRETYEEKILIINKQLQNQLDFQQKQTEELLQERNARIQIQMKLEEFESQLKLQSYNQQFDQIKQTDIINSSSGKYLNPIATSDSFSSPIQQTLSSTPQRTKGEGNSMHHFTSYKQNRLNYTPLDYESPSQQQQFSDNQNSQDGSYQEQLPLYSIEELNKIKNEKNKTYCNDQMSVSPNKTQSNQNNANLINRTNKLSIEQKVIELISKLQISMSKKKKNQSRSQNTQKMIETTKELDYAIEDKLQKMKEILTEKYITNSNNQGISNQIQSNPQINSKQVYTSQFYQ